MIGDLDLQTRDLEQRRAPLVRAGLRMVGKEGVEPSRPFGHTDLNRARLPFRHFPKRLAAGGSMSSVPWHQPDMSWLLPMFLAAGTAYAMPDAYRQLEVATSWPVAETKGARGR